MTNWHVGMKCVCIKNTFIRPALEYETFPEIGGIYTIRGFNDINLNRIYGTVLLEEIINPERKYSSATGAMFGEISFMKQDFRPLVTTNIEIFERMLSPAPKEKAMT